MADSALQTIIRTAIQREIDAYELYTRSVDRVSAEPAKQLLRELAEQERGHQLKLEALLRGQVTQEVARRQQEQITDLKLTDYLVEVPLGPLADFQDILIVAGRREKASAALYAGLAELAEDAPTAELFRFLAAEEQAHKHRVETLYEDTVYKEA
jgi:rubrerythrin